MRESESIGPLGLAGAPEVSRSKEFELLRDPEDQSSGGVCIRETPEAGDVPVNTPRFKLDARPDPRLVVCPDSPGAGAA